MVWKQDVLSENRAYWTQRAPSYSAINREELRGAGRGVWRDTLCGLLRSRFPGRVPGEVHVLEVGTGPGFFAVLLAEAGYRVTAVDLTPSMLAEARKNAGDLAQRIDFREMDAQALTFPDGAFDAVVTRNLTWNLPRPETAYQQWHRVLKPGGLLLNFDANWYRYLFDDAALAGYRQDRQNVAVRGIRDEEVGENFDVMTDIARRIPLSRAVRPAWDKRVLEGLGFRVDTDETVWRQVWNDDEKVNFASTPMFLVHAVKPEAAV